MSINLPAVALDVGEARIGFASSDEQGRFAFGRGYHTRGKKLEADVQAIRELQMRENALTVVVGLPLRTDGQDSPQTMRVRQFVSGTPNQFRANQGLRIWPRKDLSRSLRGSVKKALGSS